MNLKNSTSTRNWAIYWRWIEGSSYSWLAIQFNLSEETIKDICKSMVPDWAREKYYWRKNSYKNFRDWKKAKDKKRDMSDKVIHLMEDEPNA